MIRRISGLLFSSTAFLLAMGALLGMFLYDASLITRLFDENQRLIRWVATQAPTEYAALAKKVEAGLRFANFERMLLMVELTAAAKLLLLTVGWVIARIRNAVFPQPAEVPSDKVVHLKRVA